MNTNRNTGPAWAPDPEANSGKGEHVGSFLSMGRGYIHLHRSLTEWQWYTNERVKSVFLHLLIRCNWQDRKWMDLDIPAGSFVTSTVALASELGLSRSALVRALDILKRSGEITVKADSQRTAITLTNWAKYQCEQDEAGQPTDSKRTTAGQRTDTTKKVKHLQEGKEKKEGLRPARMSFEDFREACRVAHKDAKVLNSEEAKAFFEYWTEGHDSGKGRWQAEPFFDIVRRMRTWGQRAKVSTNGKPVPMTKAEAYAKLEEYRAANGIAPGGVVETHLIPADIYAALK